MANFECNFYLASDKSTSTNTLQCNMSNWQIGLFGSLYCEGLVLQIGRHFDIYKKSGTNGTIWNIKNTYHVSTGSYQVNTNKIKTPAVSGNIGEAIAMPALTGCLNLPINMIPFQRMKARSKCPDYRMETNTNLLQRLWYIPNHIFLKFPVDIPLEVKTTTSQDVGYPKAALKQLQAYWKDCEQQFSDRVGYGMIARLNLVSKKIRYYLFIRQQGVTVATICNSNVDELYNNSGVYFA